MEIKGTAVKSILGYVQNAFPDRVADWFNALSDESKQVVNSVVTSGWYSLEDGGIEPTKKIGALFFNNDYNRAAKECGRYSAEVALHGVYKLYVKFSSPGHIIERASRILPAYYRPATMKASERLPKSVKLIMTDIEEPNEILEYRILGWIEHALEISGCTDVQVKIPESLTKGNEQTVFLCSWN